MPTESGWRVRSEGSNKLTIKTETKAKALKIATNIAKNQRSELTMLKRDGKIQNKNSFDSDPFPARGKKH